MFTMKEYYGKRALYEEYAGLCLSEEDYNNLAQNNVIPKNPYSFFTGSFCFSEIKVDCFSGQVTGNIANCGAKLFLENWKNDLNGTKFSDNEKTAAIFFENFLIILVEPAMYSGATTSEGLFRAPRDFLPVVIPICKIKEYNVEHDSYTWGLTITFTNGVKYKAILFENQSFDNQKAYPLNLSFHINSRILGGFTHILKEQYSNCSKVTGRVFALTKNCVKEYDDRLLAVPKLISNPEVVAEVNKTVYVGVKPYINALIKNMKLISADDFPDVIKALNGVAEVIQKNQVLLDSKSEERKAVIAELSEKKEELKHTFIFKKKKKKAEISEVEEKLNQLNQEISALSFPQKEYVAAMEVIKSSSVKKNKARYSSIPDSLIPVARKVAEMCKQRNVTKLETDDEKKLFAMICSDRNVPEKYRIEEFFNCGMQEVAEATQKTNSAELQKSRMLKQMTFKDEKEKSEIVGPIKYLQKTIQEQKQAMVMANLSQQLGNLASFQANTTAVKTDSAILGGLANGIAGPIAGVSTYNRIEQQNAQAEIDAAATRQQGRENLASAAYLASGFESEAK